MGVMPCSRRNCSHILCYTYIESIGYICDECQKEFKEYINLKTQGNPPTTSKEINSELKLFIEIEKDNTTDRNITIDSYFAENTR